MISGMAEIFPELNVACYNVQCWQVPFIRQNMLLECFKTSPVYVFRHSDLTLTSS
jgi:hypothetical protein